MTDEEIKRLLGIDPNDDPYDLTPHPDRAPDDAEPDIPELFARAVRGDGLIGDVLLGFPDEDVDVDDNEEGEAGGSQSGTSQSERSANQMDDRDSTRKKDQTE